MEVQDPGPGCIDFSSWVTHAPLMFQAETSPSVSTVGYWLTLQASYGYTWTVFLGQISHPRNVFLKEREREYDMPSLQKTCSITTLQHHARPRAAMRTHSELHLSTKLPPSSTVCEAPSGFAACAWIFRISVCHALTLCSLWLSSGCQVSCDRLQTNIDWVVEGLQVESSLVSFIVYSEHEREREKGARKLHNALAKPLSSMHLQIFRQMVTDVTLAASPDWTYSFIPTTAALPLFFSQAVSSTFPLLYLVMCGCERRRKS